MAQQWRIRKPLVALQWPFSGPLDSPLFKPFNGQLVAPLKPLYWPFTGLLVAHLWAIISLLVAHYSPLNGLLVTLFSLTF